MKTVCRLFCILLILATLLLPAHATEEIDSIIADSCRYGNTADLSEYKISHSDLDRAFNRLMENGALPWYTTGQYEYRYEESTGIIQSFTPSNLPDSYDRELYEQKLAILMAECIHPGMTPEEIALSVHDRLILMSRYDETLKKNTAYDLLVDGSTVCSGYTVLYQDILNRAGVPCVSVTSEAMEHTWNLVQLGDNWYHVDLTWDDPTPDVYGTVRHTYFLLTDAQISDGEKPHYGWSTTITCNDDSYRLAYWRDLNSPVLFPGDGFAYYLIPKDYSFKVTQRELSSGKETTLFYEKYPTMLDLGHGNYTYYHTGLSWWDGKLYFGTQDKIHAMDPEGNREVVYEYNTAATKQYIYSCYVQDDIIYLFTATHDNVFSTTEVPLTVSAEQLAARHTHSFSRGQVDATCTEPGYVTGTCDCGLTYKSNWTLLDHTYAPTEPDGNKAREKCTVCGHTRVTGTIVLQPVKAEEQPRSYKYAIIGAAVGGGVGCVLALVRSLFKKRQ